MKVTKAIIVVNTLPSSGGSVRVYGEYDTGDVLNYTYKAFPDLSLEIGLSHATMILSNHPAEFLMPKPKPLFAAPDPAFCTGCPYLNQNCKHTPGSIECSTDRNNYPGTDQDDGPEDNYECQGCPDADSPSCSPGSMQCRYNRGEVDSIEG